MITANTKVTALDILNELGIKNAENVFGKMRVRIGGIPGINEADRVINIPAETTHLEVIVGNEIYELELSRGNKTDNSEIATMTEAAKAVKEQEGKEVSAHADRLQAVKALARRIKATEGAYKPTGKEEELLDEAKEILQQEADREAAAEQEAENRDVTKVKSK